MPRFATVPFLAFALTLSCAAGPPVVQADPKPATPESLAKCLARKGLHLYGASWCGPCHQQLELFGDDAKHVPYTDCQPEGSFGNIPVCDALKVDTYPTWIFPDGFRVVGVRSLKWLATSTDCPLR